MSSPCRRAAEAALLAALAALLLAGCEREKREIVSKPEQAPAQVSVSDLYAGQAPAQPPDPHAKAYEGVAFHISQGQKYFRWFNCNGCHANGGGGIGPALMDDQWRYGGRIEQIYATIAQGRPNGMPSFRDKIPPTQIWEIAAYVRSLSGQADPLAVSSRPDEMQSTPPNNHTPKAPLKSEAPGVQSAPQ
jgi:cytochrome c oxidase cbb3-type subunit 3